MDKNYYIIHWESVRWKLDPEPERDSPWAEMKEDYTFKINILPFLYLGFSVRLVPWLTGRTQFARYAAHTVVDIIRKWLNLFSDFIFYLLVICWDNKFNHFLCDRGLPASSLHSSASSSTIIKEKETDTRRRPGSWGDGRQTEPGPRAGVKETRRRSVGTWEMSPSHFPTDESPANIHSLSVGLWRSFLPCFLRA